MRQRHVFFISDGTGLTAEMLGQSLLSQFEDYQFISKVIPYIDNEEKANAACHKINQCTTASGEQPIVFATFANNKLRDIIANSNALLLDFLETFIQPLEQTLGVSSTHNIGRSHALNNYTRYKSRIDAIDFSLKTDDGANTQYYKNAQLLLVGVSRCGKTPTSLYLSLQFGLHVANYPITEEDLQKFDLPAALKPHQNKLFGLTIDVDRLISIRQERRPNSQYASPKQCQRELKLVEQLFDEHQIPYLNSTNLSIEELSTRILSTLGIERNR